MTYSELESVVSKLVLVVESLSDEVADLIESQVNTGADIITLKARADNVRDAALQLRMAFDIDK